MNISAWAIKRPIPSILLFLVLTVGGLVSFRMLGIDENPNIDIPVVTVTATQVGASPEELEVQVTRKIEDAVSGLGSIRHVVSVVNEGSSLTSVEFELGVDTDRAVNDVRDAVTRIRADLPQDIDEPQVQRLEIVGGPFATYVVSSPTMSVGELSWLVDDKISTSLLSASGVGQVQRAGGVDREIRVELDPGRLEAVGLTPDAVNLAVRNFNINLPGGRTEFGIGEQTVRTLGSRDSVEALRALQLSLPNGAKVSLSDLGQVLDTTSEPRQRAFLDGQPVVAFSVVRSSGTSVADVQAAVDVQLEKLIPTLPKDVTVEKIRSSAQHVNESYMASVEHLALGAVLAVIVIFWFLKDWRASVISAIAMPMSVVPTFIAMYAAGYTLNSMTLLGLALVVGILVDDAIVEIENIVRHIHMGKSPYEASLEAADEIGLAVIATTFTIIVVFVPMAFMGGIPGQFFGPFGLVVAVSVFFSLVVARLLTPMMAAYYMKVPPKEDEASALVRVYDRVLKAALRYRKLTVLMAVLFFMLGIGLFAMIPTSLIQPVDRGEIILTGTLPPGATLKDTTDLALLTTRRLAQRPEIQKVFVTIGSPSGRGGNASMGAVNQATFYLVLKDKSARDLSQTELELDLRQGLNEIPGVRWSYSAEGGLSGKLTLVLASRDPEILDQTSIKVVQEMQGVKGLYDIVSQTGLQQPELQILPDPQRAAELGISAQSIARTAMVATLGDVERNLAKFNLTDRQIPIRVLLNPEDRTSLQKIKRLQLMSSTGKLIPLESVADVRMGLGASRIDRYDRQRQVKIEAAMAPGTTLGEALKLVRELPSMKDRPAEVVELPAGDVEIQKDIFEGFALAMGSAVLLIYVVLVLLFGDFFQPATIMVSLPLSIAGAIFGLLITGQPLGMFALIGIVMLMGLVTKNAILLVEHCLQVRDSGMSRYDALIEAGETRLRPILMTTIAMIAGMLPIALGIGAGAEARAPMAIAVIGGLFSSTALTLVVVPVVYTFVDDFEQWIMGRRKGESDTP